MAVNREAWRRQPGEVSWAAAHVVDALAVDALEVVVMLASALLEASVLPRQLDSVELPLGKHRLEIPIHGRDAEPGRRSLRGGEDFPGQQRTTGPRDGVEDRSALARVSFHRAVA